MNKNSTITEKFHFNFQTGDTKWSTTATSVSERLLNLINYSDYENIMGETYHVLQATSSIATIIQEDFPLDDEPLLITEVISEEKNSPEKEMLPNKQESQNELKPSNEMNSSPTVSQLKSKSQPNDITDWLSLLELTKTNVNKLINDHISLLQQRAVVADMEKEDRIERIKMEQAKKNYQRLDCVRRIRKELIEKMDNLNKLLNELEGIQ